MSQRPVGTRQCDNDGLDATASGLVIGSEPEGITDGKPCDCGPNPFRPTPFQCRPFDSRPDAPNGSKWLVRRDFPGSLGSKIPLSLVEKCHEHWFSGLFTRETVGYSSRPPAAVGQTG